MRRGDGWSGLPGGRGLNIAHEAVDRHAAGLHGNRVALRWISRNGDRRDYTYDDLCGATNRFANVLHRLGVGKGDVVATLAGRIPALYVAALGTFKNGSVFTPLFSAFGPDPIVSRMTIARCTRAGDDGYAVPQEGRTGPGAHAGARARAARSRDVGAAAGRARATSSELLDGCCTTSSRFRRPIRRISRCCTSRAAPPGRPKGAMHVHEAVVAHYVTARYALDFHPDDRFWCTADPGWVTGTSYGIIAPLDARADQGRRRSRFRCRALVPNHRSEERVTVWYTAPTAIRMLMKAGAPLARRTICVACAFSAASASR